MQRTDGSIEVVVFVAILVRKTSVANEIYLDPEFGYSGPGIQTFYSLLSLLSHLGSRPGTICL